MPIDTVTSNNINSTEAVHQGLPHQSKFYKKNTNQFVGAIPRICKVFSYNLLRIYLTVRTIDRVPDQEDSFKISREVKEEMLKLKDFYSTAVDTPKNVMPWIKNGKTKSIIHPIMQYCMFKCMHEKCVFSCNDEELLRKHLEDHILLLDLMDTEEKLTNEMRRFHSKFRECCYCHMKMYTNEDLIKHIQHDHSQSIYQCQHCFYRCHEFDCIVMHNKTYHSNTNNIRLHIHLNDCLQYPITEQYHEEIYDTYLDRMPRIECVAGIQFFINFTN